MKKIIILLVVAIVISIGLTGCFKSSSLDENKIVAPTPVNLDIYGTWKITNEYTISSSNSVEQVKDIKKPTIDISQNFVSIGDMELDKPSFKFKKVQVKSYLPKEYSTLIKGVPIANGYINIISISDNTNFYLDMIMESSNKAYIYAAGNLLVVERISSNIDNKGNGSNAVIPEDHSKESGVLLGIKSIVDKDVSYKTYWISMDDGKLNDTIIMKGIMMPRMNGTFSYINTENGLSNGQNIQTLSVINHNKNGTITTEKSIVPASENRKITFVGKDYIGLEYNNPKNNDKTYKMSTVDNINSDKGLDINNVFGEKASAIYINSRKQFIDSKPSFVTDKYKLNDYDFSDITMFRNNGKWIVQSNLDSDIKGVNDLSFNINIPPTGSVVNYDSLPVSWNKIKDIDSSAKDAFASPTGNFIIILDNDSIKVYSIKNGEIDSTPIREISIGSGDVAVMGEWATGDFVPLWNKAVEEKIK